MLQKLRPALSLLAKAAVSGLLLYLSLRSVDLTGVAGRLNGAHPGWLALAVALVLTQVGMLGLRWREIVTAAGIELAPRDAVRFSLIATFFNQTLPSTIGGDASRVVMLARHAANWRNATYSVLVDRAVGLFALAVIVLVFLPLTLGLVRDPVARAALIAIGLAGIGGPLTFVALGRLRGRWIEKFWAARHATSAAKVVWALFGSAKASLIVSVLSILIHVFSVAAACAAARAVAAPLDFLTAMSIIPPVILISTIPISIAGWGVRETAMIAAFSYAGLAQGDGLIVSLIFGAATFVVGAIGGIVWIFSGERVAAAKRPDQDLR